MSRRFIYGNKENIELNKSLCEYVALRVWGEPNDFGPCGSMGVLSGDRLLGAVVFHGWQPEYGTIELSAAADSPLWLSRATIREIMDICFKQHGCQQILSRIEAGNDRALKIYDFLGFTRIRLPNMRGRGVDEILMLLTDTEWQANKLARFL